MSNIIEIIPGLYLGMNILDDFKGNIISINKPLKSEYKILNMELDPNLMYIKSGSISNKIIDYESVNNFILESYKNGVNTIIYCENLIIPMIICIEFIVKYLDMGLLETIYIVSKKTQLNTSMIPKGLLFELFEYYKKIQTN